MKTKTPNSNVRGFYILGVTYYFTIKNSERLF
jgi:hypothetical protein